MPLPCRVLGETLHRHDGPFLDTPEGVLTYADVRDHAARLASFCRAHDVHRGDTVAVAMANTAAVAEVWFGLLMDGIAPVPLNPMLGEEEISYILRMAETKMIIADGPMVAKATRWAEDSGARLQAVDAGLRPWKDYKPAEPVYVDPEDIAVIFFTSGTTGRPKGAMLSHRALIANAHGCALAYGLDASRAFACPIPIFHAFAATVCLFLPALIGGRTYLHSPLDLKGFIQTLGQLSGRRILVTVPSILEALVMLASASENNPTGSIPNVDFTVSGGAALSANLRTLSVQSTARPVYEGYGTTECGPVITSQSLIQTNSDGSVGRPIAGVEVEIRTSDGNAVPDGEIGEIVVRTPGLMSGYYDLASVTSSAIKGGWFHTSDLGYRTEAGDLFIVDRITDVITVKGITVLPQTIEIVLNRHPAVLESAIVGIPDGAGGEAPWAFVRCKAGVPLPDPSELLHYCRDRMPIFAVPKGVEFRESLPKTITGKILKRTLRQKWL